MTQEAHIRLHKSPCDNAQPGDILIYRLRPSQRPSRPDMRWLGKIESIHMLTYNKRSYFVESLEFPGDCEMVYPAQIVGYIPQPSILAVTPQPTTQELDPLI